MLIGFGQGFGLVQFEQGAAVAAVQHVRSQDTQARFEGVAMEEQDTVQVLICCFALFQLHVGEETVQIGLALVAVQHDDLVHRRDGLFVIAILVFHFAEQEVGGTVVGTVLQIHIQRFDGCLVVAHGRMDLPEQEVGVQIGSVQIVGALCSLQGQVHIPFTQAGLGQGQEDEWRVWQARISLGQIGQCAGDVVLPQACPGAFEIGFTEIGIEADCFIQEGAHICIGVDAKAGARQPHVGRTKIRVDSQGSLVGVDRTGEIAVETVGLSQIVMRVGRFRLETNDIRHRADDFVPVAALIGQPYSAEHIGRNRRARGDHVQRSSGMRHRQQLG